MHVKWARRAVVCIGLYLSVHFVVTVIDNRKVVERFQLPKKPESDGPLIMKDLGDKNSKNIIRVYVMDKQMLEPQDDIEMEAKQNSSKALPQISDNFYKEFEKEALSVRSKSDDFVLFTLINSAYLNLTLNWLCNVAPFKSKIHSKTLIATTDTETCTAIKKDWPNVKCLSFKVPNGYNIPLSWGRQAYINLLTLRSELMLTLTRLDRPYILFETDAVWLRDPMEYFRNQTLVDDADIVVPIKGYPDKGQTFTFDPMIVYPTNASRRLLTEMKNRLTANPKLFDQDVLDELCRGQFAGVVCRQFAWEDVADGKWFKLADSERGTMKPYIVNNNYYVGVHNKISRQALNGVWFLSPKRRCVISKVENALKKHTPKKAVKNSEAVKGKKHANTAKANKKEKKKDPLKNEKVNKTDKVRKAADGGKTEKATKLANATKVITTPPPTTAQRVTNARLTTKHSSTT